MRFLSTLTIVYGAGLVWACAPQGPSTPSAAAPVTFDTATVWIEGGDGATPLIVELARTERQHERGLAGRARLPTGRGMLFEFAEPRGPDDGFWMWGTSFPLDIAFLDADGVIRRILGMDACADGAPEDCPGYFPGVPYAAALEVPRGWFVEQGIDVGDRVRRSR